MMGNRPAGVTAIAILAIVNGLVQLYAGLAFLGVAIPGMEVAGLAEGVGLGVSLAMFIIAALSMFFGIGALMFRSGAWTLGVALFGASLALDLAIMFTSASIASVAIAALLSAIVLSYLLSSGVRTAFGHSYETRSRYPGGPIVHA